MQLFLAKRVRPQGLETAHSWLRGGGDGGGWLQRKRAAEEKESSFSAFIFFRSNESTSFLPAVALVIKAAHN